MFKGLRDKRTDQKDGLSQKMHFVSVNMDLILKAMQVKEKAPGYTGGEPTSASPHQRGSRLPAGIPLPGEVSVRRARSQRRGMRQEGEGNPLKKLRMKW